MSAIDQSIAEESSAEFGTTFFEFSIAESYTVASVRKSFHIVISYTPISLYLSSSMGIPYTEKLWLYRVSIVKCGHSGLFSARYISYDRSYQCNCRTVSQQLEPHISGQLVVQELRLGRSLISLCTWMRLGAMEASARGSLSC